MANIEAYDNFETAWCPGCGNHSIIKSIKQALTEEGLEPHQVLICSGIGQAAKTPHYINCNGFNGLHGRSLPAATGAHLANPELKILVTSGDGCNYGEGGNHFLAAIRRNPDITLLVYDNQIYGLTKGQASPTSAEGMHTKAQPHGVHNNPFNPLLVAIAMRAGFVARGFSGEIDHLAGLIRRGMNHRGLAIIDILQPCVSFNKVNTFKWYKDRVYKIAESHDPGDWQAAMKLAEEFGEKIPLGLIYENSRQPLDEHYEMLAGGPLPRQKVDLNMMKTIFGQYR